MHKIKLLINSIIGYLYKFFIDIHILKVPNLNEVVNQEPFVVSITSFGRRVTSNIIYYTMVSILRQSVKPNKIILWLSKDKFCDETLPSKLKSLQKRGVEVRYCNDIRSYTKLVPTLNLNLNLPVVTLDDDILYSKNTLKYLWNGHKKHPQDIICLTANTPVFENGVPQQYGKWVPLCHNQSGQLIFPLGVGGVLYPTGCLNAEATNENLFKQLCPLADDIWFWFNGLRNHTCKQYINKHETDYSFDRIYHYFHKGSSLTHANNDENQNDKQFKQVFEFYGALIAQDELLMASGDYISSDFCD